MSRGVRSNETTADLSSSVSVFGDLKLMANFVTGQGDAGHSTDAKAPKLGSGAAGISDWFGGHGNEEKKKIEKTNMMKRTTNKHHTKDKTAPL